MLQCNKCGSKQDEGKFCGACGGELVEASEVESTDVEQPAQAEDQSFQAEEEVSAAEAPVEASSSSSSNEMMDQAVGASKEFGSYFKEYIKAPSLIFSKGESEFKNGIISMSIVALLISLSLSGLYRNIGYQDFGFGPSPFSVFGSGLLFMVIVMIVTVALLFIINKLFGTDYSFKEMTSVFGGHMVPVIVVALLAFVLALVKSNTAGWLLVFIAFGLVVTTVPIYLISSLLTKRSKGIDPLYGYLLYLVAVGITFTILFVVFIDSAVGRLLDNIPF